MVFVTAFADSANDASAIAINKPINLRMPFIA
jgi:hypothetical protein